MSLKSKVQMWRGGGKGKWGARPDERGKRGDDDVAERSIDM